MSKKNQFSGPEKLAILQEFEMRQTSQADVVRKYDINLNTLMDWRHRYELYGYEGLEIRTHNKKYPTEIKQQAVQDYLSGTYSQNQIIDKYNIASRTQLRIWVKKYNNHGSFNSTKSEGAYAVIKGRTTSWKERIEIVLYCLSNNYDYQNTALKFRVSYQQVYQWVKKYNDGGEDALKDGRGHKKAPEKLSDAERQILTMKKLEHENERLRAENALLKKLQQLEGKRY